MIKVINHNTIEYTQTKELTDIREVYRFIHGYTTTQEEVSAISRIGINIIINQYRNYYDTMVDLHGLVGSVEHDGDNVVFTHYFDRNNQQILTQDDIDSLILLPRHVNRVDELYTLSSNHWFDASNMKFFNTRLHTCRNVDITTNAPKAYTNVFIYSNKHWNDAREYFIAYVDIQGNFNKLSKAYNSLRSAENALNTGKVWKNLDTEK